MPPYVLAFLIGVIAGLRSLTAPAVVSWAARLTTATVLAARWFRDERLKDIPLRIGEISVGLHIATNLMA